MCVLHPPEETICHERHMFSCGGSIFDFGKGKEKKKGEKVGTCQKSHQLHYQDTRVMDRPFLMLRTRCVQERSLHVISRRGRHGARRQHKSFQRCRLNIQRTFTQHQSWLFFVTVFASYWKQAIQDISINPKATKWRSWIWAFDRWSRGRPIRRRSWETSKNCSDWKPAGSSFGVACSQRCTEFLPTLPTLDRLAFVEVGRRADWRPSLLPSPPWELPPTAVRPIGHQTHQSAQPDVPLHLVDCLMWFQPRIFHFGCKKAERKKQNKAGKSRPSFVRRVLRGKELIDMAQKTAYERQDQALPSSIDRTCGAANDQSVPSIKNKTTHHASLFCVWFSLSVRRNSVRLTKNYWKV